MIEEEKKLIRDLDSLNGDQEDDHIAAEGLLLNFIEKEVSSEIAAAYRLAKDRVGFWYA